MILALLMILIIVIPTTISTRSYLIWARSLPQSTLSPVNRTS